MRNMYVIIALVPLCTANPATRMIVCARQFQDSSLLLRNVHTTHDSLTVITLVGSLQEL